MLRHRLARPWLAGRNLIRALGPDRDPFQILIFHDVAEEATARFADLMDGLLARHAVLSPADAEAWIAGTPPPRPARQGAVPCLITLDDGFASNFALARDILVPRGIRALFFVCPGLMDLSPGERENAIAERIFDGRAHGRASAVGKRLMSWDEVAELQKAGHAIGAHGLTHRRLATLQGDALAREIVEAGDRLEARLGCEIRWFAHAFGDIASLSGEALDIIAGRYAYCRTGIRGTLRAGAPPSALTAQEMGLDGPRAYQELIVQGGLDVFHRAARQRLFTLAGI